MHEQKSPQHAAEPTFLIGGGELGARMHAIDWSKSSLGPVDQWPQSLKTAVRIMLTSRQAMFVWWGDELINLYNDAYKAIVGGKHPEALGQPASQVWREIWEQVGPRAASAMRDNEGTYDEALLLIMERNGYPEETYYTFSYSPVPNDQGGSGGIICANTDDTQRIIGERQLSLLRELATRTADARTFELACARSGSALALNGHDLPFAAIYLVEPEHGRLVLAGSAGIPQGHVAFPASVDLEHPSPWPFAEVWRSHQPFVISDLSAVPDLPTGAWDRPPRQAVAVPIAASGQTGKSGVLLVGLNPFRLFDDRYRGFIGLVATQIAASIANAQAYEEERKRAESLAELDRAKTAFFSNVSHEFRTPLTLMLGPTEDALLSDEQALSGENLRIVHRNELRLLKLVNSLLDFSRIEAGRAQASYQETDLGALTRDLASAFRAAIERAGLRFEVACAVLPGTVFVDHEMWEKIVLNLLSNALKFTFAGSISVSLAERDNHAELTVSDTGIGIAREELAHLFERFHRVQGARARTHEGSGIGLALVSELVRLHGGTICVDSKLDQGTMFTISIPFGSSHLPGERVNATRSLASTATGAAPYVAEALRWLPGSETALGEQGSSAPVAQAEGLHSKSEQRILLADDNADMRDYICRILRERWTVEAVADGREALDAARRARPDLLLTDVMMPNLDGFGLLRAFRAEPELANVPVVMLSARAGDESRIEGLEAGADDYLAKPFSARELSARVNTHLQIASLRAAAENEREKLSALFMQAPIAIVVLEGPEHRFVLANPTYSEMLGREDSLGKTVREVFPELSEHEVIASLDRVYRTGEPLRVVELKVPVSRHGAQSDAFFSYVAQPLHGAGGAVTGMMVVAHEVTEQVMARDRMDTLRAAAEQANRAKDEFLAMLGHELRNPLSPITTALHLMRLRAGNVAERERLVIERQVSHLARLVDDLLDVSRITRGKVELKRRRVELAEVVAEAIEMASPLLEQRQHHLELSIPSQGLPVEGDAMRLSQVLCNVLTNAAKYTAQGGKIRVSAHSRDEHVVIEVEDNGIGISAEMLPLVFELFSQERQTLDRSQGGLGLGLAIARGLVAMHGGNIAVASAGEGHGTKITIELPALDPLQDELSKRASAPSEDPNATRNGARNVLVVDDNQDAAELLAEWLGTLGHVTRIAHDGPEALRLAADFRPDVAFLDIGLPVMDGYELARRLRNQPGLSALKLIAVTGYGREADRQLSSAAGFDSHLVKPVVLDSLDALLR